MSNIVKIESTGLEFEVNTDEPFDEDKNNEKVLKKIKDKKSFFFNKWFNNVFIGSTPEFKPKLLSNEEYAKKGYESVDIALELLTSNNWKEQKRGVEGDIVEAKETEKFGKIFRMTGVYECPAEFLFDEFVNKVDDVPKWNSSLIECYHVQQINDDTDITYQLASTNPIKPRDFVNLRCNIKRDDTFITCASSVEFPGCPPNNKCIRGENKVSLWTMRSMPPDKTSGRKRCEFQWMSCANLKGWIPQYIVDLSFSTVMLDFSHSLRIHIEKRRHENVF